MLRGSKRVSSQARIFFSNWNSNSSNVSLTAKKTEDADVSVMTNSKMKITFRDPSRGGSHSVKAPGLCGKRLQSLPLFQCQQHQSSNRAVSTMANSKPDLWALDFDGVVCDSCGESALSAWKVRKASCPVAIRMHHV